jgi:hypothetical protein
VEFAVVHLIRNAAAWQEALDAHDTFPLDFTLLAFAEAQDRSRAFCLWRTPSREALQESLDRFFGHAALNEVFPVDVHVLEPDA